MPQSFFDLTPHNDDHVCMTRRDLTMRDHRAYMASLAPGEYDRVFGDACALANHFYRALITYEEEHPGISYAAIMEALMLMEARIDQDLAADETTLTQEDCDA